MATFTPVNNLKAIPLPQVSVTSGLPLAGGYTLGRLSPRWHTDVPLPQFAPNNNLYPIPAPPMIPIKPLPGSTGGGGAVGSPIDSG